MEGINNYIKNHDFETSVFTQPVEEQADKYSKILIDCFDRFVPKKTVFIKPQSIPWCNAYTRLLLRQKNRNYKFFKTVTQKHHQASLNPNSTLQTLTQLSLKKQKAQSNYKTASKESLKANRRAKNSFYNSVNSTMLNYDELR